MHEVNDYVTEILDLVGKMNMNSFKILRAVVMVFSVGRIGRHPENVWKINRSSRSRTCLKKEDLSILRGTTKNTENKDKRK